MADTRQPEPNMQSAVDRMMPSIVSEIADAQPGDLISYDNSGRNVGADHIAIYIGNGMMIEAPKAGVPVRAPMRRCGKRQSY